MVCKKKLLILVFCIALISVACIFFFLSNYSVKANSICKDCNVLLVSLDSCSANHMSTYGYTRDTTPNFTQLSKEGIFFENAYTNGTWTLPSHVSIFTGLYSFIHNVTESYDSSLAKNLPLLPAILQKNGYETYFFAPRDEATFPGDRVYARGVTYWDDTYWKYRDKEDEYLDVAIQKISENNDKSKKSFVFFHTNMCHSPYFTEDAPLLYTEQKFPTFPLKLNAVFNAPFTKEYYHYLLNRLPIGLADGDFRRYPERIESLLRALQQAPDFATAKRVYEDAEKNQYWGEVGMDDYKEKFEYWDKIDVKNAELVEYLKALYDQKMHSVDATIIARLRQKLQTENWKNNTVVVITADHGEEFMEHGAIGHTTLYDFNTKIPLLFLIPKIKPVSVKSNVQHVDIAPTILELLGISNIYHFSGKSLVDISRGKVAGDRLLIAGGDMLFHPDLTTVREGSWKLFISERDNSILPYALYNTAEDSDEMHDILKENMGRASTMIQKYKSEKEKNMQFIK